MEVLYPHCAGLDIHKETVVACARHMVNGTIKREVRTFRTTTKDLLALSEWLASQGCTHIAMEATGVYWKPVWHVLSDGDFTLVLANAGHVKNVPGRKTDVNDATWLADLMAHGLITHVEPFRAAVLLLTTIPGVSDLSAHVIRAEIGGDMSRFPTVGHLISWAGLCPKNDESAGKRRSNRMRKGAPWLKTTLIQCAWEAARKNGSYLQAQFHRLRSRRGSKKAIGALAASILTAAYHMLKDGT